MNLFPETAKCSIFSIIPYTLPKSLFLTTPVQKWTSNMSVYAAGLAEKKNESKLKKSRNVNGNKHKTSSIEKPSVTGYCIRNKVKRLLIFSFETYLSLIFGLFVIVYVYGRRLFSYMSVSKHENILHNPYNDHEKNVESNVRSFRDVRSVNPVTEDETDIKIKPPQCLEDSIFGGHKFIKIQVYLGIFRYI